MLLKDSSLAPTLQGSPTRELAPDNLLCSGLALGNGAPGWGGGDRQLTLGSQALHSHREDTVLGKTCPQRTIWLPSALNLRTRGGKGAGTLPESTSRGHQPRPPQTAGWQLGENGGTFPPPPPPRIGWVPVMFLPALPQSPVHREGFCHHVLLMKTLLVPGTALLGRKGRADCLGRAS